MMYLPHPGVLEWKAERGCGGSQECLGRPPVVSDYFPLPHHPQVWYMVPLTSGEPINAEWRWNCMKDASWSSTSGCCQPLPHKEDGLRDSESTANNREPQFQPCKSDSRATLFFLCAAFCDSLLISRVLFHANTSPLQIFTFPLIIGLHLLYQTVNAPRKRNALSHHSIINRWCTMPEEQWGSIKAS